MPAIINNPDQTAIALLTCARRSVEDLIRHNNGGWTALISEWNFTTNAVTITGDVTLGGSIISNCSTTVGLQAGIFNYAGNMFPNNSIIQSVDSPTQITMNQNATAGGLAQRHVFGQAGYQLPTDFKSFVDSTMWDRSRFWAMRGPMTPQQWQLYKSSMMGKASIQRRWRVKQHITLMGPDNIPNPQLGVTYFFIDPTPTDVGSQLVFEYNSNSPILSALGNPQKDWQADTDGCKLDEYIIELGVRWRMLKRFGYDYSTEFDEYERAADVYVANDGGAGILSISPDPDLGLIGPWNVPESGYGNQ